MNSILENNDFLYGVSCILVAVYASKTQIKLPSAIRKLFSSNIFRVVFLSIFAMYLNKNTKPHVALIVSIVFVITLEYINQEEIKENYEYTKIIMDNKKK